MSYQCSKPSNLPAKCTNCNGPHPANYRQCEYHPTNRNQKPKNSRNQIPHVHRDIEKVKKASNSDLNVTSDLLKELKETMEFLKTNSGFQIIRDIKDFFMKKGTNVSTSNDE